MGDGQQEGREVRVPKVEERCPDEVNVGEDEHSGENQKG